MCCFESCDATLTLNTVIQVTSWGLNIVGLQLTRRLPLCRSPCATENNAGSCTPKRSCIKPGDSHCVVPVVMPQKTTQLAAHTKAEHRTASNHAGGSNCVVPVMPQKTTQLAARTEAEHRTASNHAGGSNRTKPELFQIRRR